MLHSRHINIFISLTRFIESERIRLLNQLFVLMIVYLDLPNEYFYQRGR